MRGRWGSGKDVCGSCRRILQDVSLELTRPRREMERELKPGVFLGSIYGPAEAVPLLQSAVVLRLRGGGAAPDGGAPVRY
jgi:hypothetical protein